MKNKKPLGEKTGPRFFTIQGGPGEQDSWKKIDGVNFSPRPGQNFTTPGAKFHRQSRRQTRHKIRKISHQVSLHFSPQDSPQDFATRFATSFTTNSLEDSPLDFATRFPKLQGRPLAACGGSCLRMAAETPTDGDS